MADFEYVDVNGRQIRVRPRETAQEIDEYGNFHRQPNRFTEGFGEGKNPVEKDRYILFWAKGCNWSNRAAIARELLGLEDAVKVEIVDWTDREENLGWEFVNSPDHINPETGAQFLSELYYNADEEYTLYFETAWKPYHKEGAPDLYPEDLREEIDKLNDIIFREVNNGVYKAGFARKQKAYDRAYNMVFNRLDWLEERLANQRYLFGDRLTESDVRLYVTLVRFDCAYYPVFRLNKKLLRDYPNLWAYARDLYQTPGFGDTTNFAAIKKHYHIDCCPSNEFAIVPNGPDESLWLTPHGREKLSGK